MKTVKAHPDIPRATLSAVVDCLAETPAGCRSYLAMDVSEGGMFLRTLFPLDLGTKMICSFDLPDGQPPVKAVGEVVWIRRGHTATGRPPGMGVKFETITRKNKGRARAYVSGLEDEDIQR